MVVFNFTRLDRDICQTVLFLKRIDMYNECFHRDWFRVCDSLQIIVIEQTSFVMKGLFYFLKSLVSLVSLVSAVCPPYYYPTSSLTEK